MSSGTTKKDFFHHTLKAKGNEEIDMNTFKKLLAEAVILKAMGEVQMTFAPEDFITYQKFVFYMDAEGKLAAKKEKRP